MAILAEWGRQQSFDISVHIIAMQKTKLEADWVDSVVSSNTLHLQNPRATLQIKGWQLSSIWIP